MKEENRKLEQLHIKALLFDLDGTIIDTYELILASMRYALENVLGQHYPDAQLMEKVGQPLLTQMYDYTDSDETVDELLRVYRHHNKIYEGELAKSFPGTKEALEAMKRAGFPMGIVTSKMHGPALRGLQQFELDEYFNFIIGSDDCERHKPHPEPVLYGAKLMNVDPRSCVYVGDSPFDIQSGNAAGTYTIAALWGMFSLETLENEQPNALCENIANLPTIIQSLK